MLLQQSNFNHNNSSTTQLRLRQITGKIRFDDRTGCIMIELVVSGEIGVVDDDRANLSSVYL